MTATTQQQLRSLSIIHTYSVSTTVSLWCDACDVSATPAMSGYTRTGQASVSAVSKGVKEGTMPPGMLMSDCNHPATAPRSLSIIHTYSVSTTMSLWCDACDVNATLAMSGYAHGPSVSFGGE